MTITAHDIAAGVRRGERSAVTAVRASIAAIHARNGQINAFVEVFEHAALRRAQEIDELVRAGQAEGLALAGVPVAIKDNICVGPDLLVPGDGRGFGGKTTCASRILENYRSPFSATCVQRLIDAGAVIVGKTNLDEFGMGSSTEHSIHGPTRNPADLSRVAGGSSGGSAAAVAAGMVPLAMGSDTGGSVRQPAAWCGVVGLKPTYGRVSRYGLVAYASSLDQVGVLATSTEDAGLAMRVIAGHDPKDSTSDTREWRTDGSVATPKRIGVPTQARSHANHPEIARLFGAWLDARRAEGAEIVDVELPMLDASVAAYYVVALAEASSNLARFDGVRYGRAATLASGEGLIDLYERSRGEGFGAEVKRRIMLGTHLLSAGYQDAFYVRALRARRRLAQDYARAFERCDVIATPTTPSPAFRVGERVSDPLSMYLEDVYTVGVNLAGLPAASIPMGQARVDGALLPVGVQLVAPAFEESRLL